MAKQNQKFTTNWVRVLYSHISKAHAYQDGDEPKYDITVIIPKKDTVTLNEIARCCMELGHNIEELLMDADASDTYSGREECKDSYVLSMKSKYEPNIYQMDGEKVVLEPYAGEFVQIIGSVYEYSYMRHKGISTNLKAVLLSGKGDEITYKNPFAKTIEKGFVDIDDLPF